MLLFITHSSILNLKSIIHFKDSPNLAVIRCFVLLSYFVMIYLICCFWLPTEFQKLKWNILLYNIEFFKYLPFVPP